MRAPRDELRRDRSGPQPHSLAADTRRGLARIHPLIPLGLFMLGFLMVSSDWTPDDVRGPFYATLGTILIVVGVTGYLAGEVARRWGP